MTTFIFVVSRMRLMLSHVSADDRMLSSPDNIHAALHRPSLGEVACRLLRSRHVAQLRVSVRCRRKSVSRLRPPLRSTRHGHRQAARALGARQHRLQTSHLLVA